MAASDVPGVRPRLGSSLTRKRRSKGLKLLPLPNSTSILCLSMVLPTLHQMVAVQHLLTEPQTRWRFRVLDKSEAGEG